MQKTDKDVEKKAGKRYLPETSKISDEIGTDGSLSLCGNNYMICLTMRRRIFNPEYSVIVIHGRLSIVGPI